MTASTAVGATVPVRVAGLRQLRARRVPQPGRHRTPLRAGTARHVRRRSPCRARSGCCIVLNPGAAQACTPHSGLPQGHGETAARIAHAGPRRAAATDRWAGGRLRAAARALCPLECRRPGQPQRAVSQRPVPAPARRLECTFPSQTRRRPVIWPWVRSPVGWRSTVDNTANFAIQTDPHPTVSAPTSWSWTTKDTPQVIQVAATISSDTQRENNDAFYSGVLFGVVGGASDRPRHGARRSAASAATQLSRTRVQRFCQFGFRFSANAFGPSLASSLLKTSPEISDSIR